MQSPPALTATDLVCFSHLRWNFVFQRPQHLLTRAASTFRVHFIEEPKLEPDAQPRLDVASVDGVTIVVPILPTSIGPDAQVRVLRRLVRDYVRQSCPSPKVAWYYTPMALRFSRDLQLPVCVYDCMDELTTFKDAPPELANLERELLDRATVVFTGGQSLFEVKRRLHGNVHAFPSSVDVGHFLPARSRNLPEPSDLIAIDHPRIGYFGVIDERLDYELIEGIARARPDWQLIMIGPVVKIDPAILPRAANIHWLGGKPYRDLPAYLSSIDVGLMPFAINAATRYISPTKTPEFLAAGLPVVSTPIVDVVRSWGEWGLVEIAADAEGAAASLAKLLHQTRRSEWLARADQRLAAISWDRTWTAMLNLIARAEGKARRRSLARAAELEVSHV